jgi:hypothetical protein
MHFLVVLSVIKLEIWDTWCRDSLQEYFLSYSDRAGAEMIFVNLHREEIAPTNELRQFFGRRMVLVVIFRPKFDSCFPSA